MNNSDLRALVAELKALEAVATPAPWACYNGYKLVTRTDGKMACERIGPVTGGGITSTGGIDLMATKADFELVAHLRNNATKLLAALDDSVAVREQVTKLEGSVVRLVGAARTAINEMEECPQEEGHSIGLLEGAINQGIAALAAKEAKDE